MANSIFFLLVLHFLRLVAAQNETKHVSGDLFNSLEELSRLVDISYCVGTSGVQQPFQCLSRCVEFPDLELVATWNTGVLLSDSCGYVAISHPPSPKRIVIAFRGTYSITNTIIDLSAYPQAYVPYTGDDNKIADTQSLRPSGSRCENCTVHAGFMASWLDTRSIILPHISEAMQKYPDYEVTLVGHSLGGAVAALAGLEMRLKGWDPQVTTFGEPMLGNGDFAQFFDEQFDLQPTRSNKSLSQDKNRFRRITHVDDPVPLLPLQEWGYEPHAGEIFISKSYLPPSLGDVHPCVGHYDPRCIAGSEAPALLRGMYHDINIPVDLSTSSMNHCPMPLGNHASESGEQVLLGQWKGQDTTSCKMGHSEDRLSLIRWDWSLIPAKYRLWELFYAHRDYFWRIGLCVPGGDPSG
ncbi:hypothetical protein PENARI_c001G02143 [Penicillium arizonense]|uniref:Fungal lipase-type domain-containing protein n=1 Tax=Penicillium arizonense TaxID=1835702 RepID=A0A1F5LX81_PENAI|nr:hypothetical protein PENARI_c001G02143 [Penicillium arizonense]OGE57762.1 hypothetical protein PENARI_c001G02143 [Penicillium arizonense]